MAFPGHRWQIQLTLHVIVDYLIQRIDGFSLSQSAKRCCLNNLNAAKGFIENWEFTPATEQILSFVETVQAEGSAGNIGETDAELLIEPANRVLNLLRG